eukprot:TRINITY_DN542_c0_g1_i1.p1 TRINITY_DN542_c0_g1~~TRINITY_DN542_c0_g1_i1.p1  ORF type:complete len:1085 (-),score=290.63 TRINITY_DN542_c0_g1_i1:1051-4281(-)
MALPTQQEFEGIVRQLMSPDNSARGQAEAIFEQAKGNPTWLVPALMTVIQQSNDAVVREMSSVLLRRVLKAGKDGLFDKLSAEVQHGVKSELLKMFTQEQARKVRRSISHCIGGLASTLVEEGKWPELFPFLFASVRDGHVDLRQGALTIFASLATTVADEALVPHLPVLKEAFQFALSEGQPSAVRMAALDASVSLVVVMEDEKMIGNYRSLLPGMLQAIAQALNENEVDLALKGLEVLITAAEAAPSFFNKFMTEFSSALLQIAQAEGLDPKVRHAAVEAILTLCETDGRGMKKVPTLVDTFFPLCMQWMTTVKHEQEWGVEEEDEDEDDEITNYDVGLEALDRLALALGGKVIEPVATQAIGKALSSSTDDPQNWRFRYAGLMALAQIAEGCQKQFESKLGAIVHMLLRHLDDHHERVRWAAVHAIAQYCNDFQPGFQLTFHAQVLPALMRMLGDPVPRIAAHAGLAVVNFMDEADKSFTQPYLDELVTKLLLCLQASRHRFVTEQCLSAISAVAENSEQMFEKYYDTIVPYLKQVLGQQNFDRKDRMLRAKAIECVSLIGMSVGKEKFGPDAREVMEMLHRAQQVALEPDDPQASYLLQAWGRIAKCLGPDFAPYLQLCIPPVLQQASVETEVTIADVEDDDDGDDDGEEGVETLMLAIKGVGDKKIKIKTAMLEDKHLACDMLVAYLDDLGEVMFPFAKAISDLMLPLLKFPYMDEVRDSASKALIGVQKCIKLHLDKVAGAGADRSILREACEALCSNLINAIKKETNVTVMGGMVEAYYEVLGAADANSLSQDTIALSANIFKQVFDESLQRREEVAKAADEVEDDDEHELDKLEEEADDEEDLLTQVVEAIGALVKHCEAFLPHFATTFYPMCRDLLTDKYGDLEHKLALCTFDDFVEHGSKVNRNALGPFVQEIISFLLKFVADSDCNVVQAAAYGLGVTAVAYPEVFTQVVPDAVQRLVTVLNHPEAKNDDNIHAATNVASALLKISEAHHGHASGAVSEQTILGTVLSRMPYGGDEIEAEVVHKKVAHLLLANASPLVAEWHRTSGQWFNPNEPTATFHQISSAH